MTAQVHGIDRDSPTDLERRLKEQIKGLCLDLLGEDDPLPDAHRRHAQQ